MAMAQRRDNQPRVPIAFIVLVVLCLLAAFALYEYQHRQGAQTAHTPPGAPVSPQMLLGNPSDATPDPANRDNYLMIKPYYVLSYNDSKGTPNWVSWQVTEADLGTAPRKQTFDPDDTLPLGFNRITHNDYTGSGFDRGHMCPHSDRAANEQMSFATFVMTNIIPQAPNVNRKAWAQLEVYGRELVSREHDHLYITAGPAGKGGRGSKGERQTIGNGNVTVPAECWKMIVVVPDDGGDDLAKINPGTRVIAVIMPNDQSQVGEEWAGFRTTVAAVEQQTGFKFFDRVPASIAQTLRNKIDQTPIAAPRPLVHRAD